MRRKNTRVNRGRVAVAATNAVITPATGGGGGTNTTNVVGVGATTPTVVAVNSGTNAVQVGV